MAVTKYLDKTGLTYFCSKIKAWANAAFAAISHTHGNITNTGTLSTASRAVITDSNKKITVSSTTTATEIGYLSGVTSNIQTQLNNKADSSAIPTIPNLSLTTSGSGNAITALSVSNHAITATKGSTFLTSHQSLANYVTLNSAQTISAVKTFTAKPVLNQVGLDMTVKDTTEGSTTTRTSQVLHANSSNSSYGINIAFCSGGNAVVGGGEAGTSQLTALAGNSGENLYLVADGSIYLKPNGNTWANAKQLTVTTNGGIEFNALEATRGTAPASLIERCLADVKDSASNRISLISTNYYTDKSSLTSIWAYKTTAATGNNIGNLGIGCDASGNVYTVAPTPAVADNSTKIATTAWVRTATGNFACNAATATKLATARSISAGNLEFQGSADFDGSGNINLDVTYQRSIITVGNTNNYSFHRIAYISTYSGSYNDRGLTLLVSKDFNGGGYGIVRIIFRTNNVSNQTAASCTVQWLVRTSDIPVDAIQVGFNSTTGASYLDVFYKSSGSYGSAVCRVLACSTARNSVGRGFTVIDASTEVSNTTASDALDSIESYATIAVAGTKLHSKAYTDIIAASDVGIVESAASCTGNAATATTLATTRTINGTNFNGSANITTANWGTARNISISDSDGTNTGSAVSVNGSANATLKLPATIKASITGNCSGTSSNVTGTVAIANGGTGATTRLNAVKALTNENVGTNATFFLTITDSWGKAGFTSVANAKTVLGLGSAAYTASTAYAAASHTHSYLPLAGGTMTGSLTFKNANLTLGTLPSSYQQYVISHVGSDSKNTHCMYFVRNTDGTTVTYIRSFKYSDTSVYGDLTVVCQPDGTRYGTAPTPSSVTDDSNKIATTAWVRDATGNFACNSATATKFASSQSVTLTGAITGTASSQAGWSVGTIWRSCMVGQSSPTNTKPWYKVATCVVDSDHAVYNIVFLVEDTYYVHDSVGILKIHIRTEETSAVNLEATELFWMSSTASIANNLDHYVLVCPTTTNPTVELWTKIPYGYQHKRFTVLTEGTRASTQIKWTLLNASTAGQAASITTSGTQIESKLRSVASNVTGTVAIANGGTGATTRLNAIKALTNENVSTNATHFLGLKSDWSKVGYFTLAEAKTLLGLKSAAYTESSAYATSEHTHSYLPLAGGTLTGNLTISKASPVIYTKSTGMTRNTAPSANVNVVEILGQDSAGKSTWGIYHTYSTAKVNQVQLICYKGTSTDTTWSGIGVGYDSSGNVFTNAPTPATADDSTKIATTAFVKAQGYLTSHQSLSAYAKLASPALTGTPTAPTAAASTNNTQIATTAFVKAQGYLTSHQTLPTLSLTSSGSGNAVTAISVSNHAITVTKGTTFLTSHQSLSNYVTLDSNQTVTGSKTFSWIALKNATIDRTLADTTTDHWFIAGCYLDKNGKSLIDLGFHRKEDRNWSLRLYDTSGTQHWMMFQGINHDGTSPYISVGGDFHTMNNGEFYCGLSTRRWKAVYAVNGTIQTSDERIKEDIDKLPEAVLDAWESVEWMQFRMKSSVEKKGNSARLHSGIIAQHARDAFASVGLDASDYGFFCWDQWDKTPAMLDEKGEVAIPEIPAGDQYSIRYDEALAIEAAYQRRKNKILENHISELEKRLAKLEGTV